MPANSCRPPIGCGDRNAIRPRSQGKRYANYLWVDPVFQFQAILLPSRARSINCSSARPEDVCSPGSSRLAPAPMSCAIEPACFVSGDSPALIFLTRYIGSGTIFHRRAFTKKRRPKKGAAGFFYPSPKKRESTLISRGFAAFVSSHLYSMSSRLDTKGNSLTGFSHLWYFFLEICAAKKKKACRRIVSVIRRQN